LLQKLISKETQNIHPVNLSL